MGTSGGDGSISGITLSAEEASLNANLPRWSEVAGANRLRTDGMRWVPKVNGEFKIPVVSIHTLGDLYLPWHMAQSYRSGPQPACAQLAAAAVHVLSGRMPQLGQHAAPVQLAGHLGGVLPARALIGQARHGVVGDQVQHHVLAAERDVVVVLKDVAVGVQHAAGQDAADAAVATKGAHTTFCRPLLP